VPILELAIPLPETGATAFEDLLRLHEPQVARTAYRLLGRTHDAQDATQEVFLRLHRHLHSLAPGSNVPAWLYRVTVNVCRDILRRRTPFCAIDRDFAAATPSPEHLTEHEQRKRLVAEALQYLTPQERECITLHDIEGLPTRDVAIAAGCSEVTVRSHLSSGRARLRAIIERRRS
jgi:RNA polymerase sigma-70 factor (ECF subfamily)